MDRKLSTHHTHRFLQGIDFLFIIVSSIGSLSMIQFVTYNILPLPASVNLLIFSVVLYAIRFGGRFGGISFVIKNRLLLGISFLYAWEILQGLIVDNNLESILVRVVFLCSAYVSCFYLFELIREGKPIAYILKPYCYYALYVTFSIVLLSILIILGLVSPFTNILSNNDLIADNANRSTYFFPAFLSVVIQEPNVFLGNMGIPMICGLSHEPQVNCFVVLPAIIMLMYVYSTKKMIDTKVYGIIILLCLLSTSFTGLICSAVVVAMHIIWNLQINKKYSRVIILVLFLLVVFLFFIQLGYYEIFITYMEVKADFENAASSGGVSLGLLDYIISSNSFWGQGIFCTQDSIKFDYSNNMGYVSSLLVSTFYIILFFTALRNCLSKKNLCHIIGLATMYFCLHSLKYGIVLFKYNYLFFILFLLSYSDYKRRKHSIC